MLSSKFEIEVDNCRQPYTVLIPRGELDAYNSPRLRDLFVGLQNDGCRQVVVDLSRVDFIDSSGLGVLIGGLKRFRSQDGDLSLVCPQPKILGRLKVSGLTSVFVVATTMDDAIA